MLISLKWLSDWVDLGDLSVDDIVETLSVSGLEVASVKNLGLNQDKIVVAKIEKIQPHPSADRLVVCNVNVGDSQPQTIVCGAKNMAAGDCVPCALPGAQPPGIDFAISTRKVMGVTSAGMLCSKEELALAESSEGLWILPHDAEAKIGSPIFDAMGITDTIIEIEVTPNRPDALCHRGVARDLAALFHLQMRSPDERIARLPLAHPSSATLTSNNDLSVTLDTNTPVHYALSRIANLDVKPSPEWLQLSLEKLEFRPVNEIVDLTNFVMLDIGQPLHAFDADVAGSKIIVRNGIEGEAFEAINHKTYSLHPNDLVIASEHCPLALAGVMGGCKSEVSNATKNILLECACFCPTSVRKTSKRHSIHSDASHRYERGMDDAAIPDNLNYTLQIFARILGIDLANGDFSKGDFEVVTHNLDDLQPRKVLFSTADYKRLVGEEIDANRARQILESLGLTVTSQPSGEEGAFEVFVPRFRPDIERPVDLVEELLRIIGMNSVEASQMFKVTASEYKKRDPIMKVQPTIIPNNILHWMRSLRENLLAYGFYEHVAYSFISEKDLDDLLIPEDNYRRTDAVKIANPLTSDQAMMRTTMLPAMLAAARLNATRRNFDYAMFEIGRTYFVDTIHNKNREPMMLSLVACGKISHHFSDHGRLWNFYDFKGILEDLFNRHGQKLQFRAADNPPPYLHPNVQAEVYVLDHGESRRVGTVGRLHPKVRAELADPFFFAEIELEALQPHFAQPVVAQPSSKFQSVSRDFAFIAPKSITWSQIYETIISAANASSTLVHDLRSCEVFDVYEGDSIEKGSRSLAVSVIYQSDSKTLTEEEISSYDEIILSAIQNDLHLTLRS